MASPPPHVLVFPFMAKGHAIPLVELARLLIRHGAAVTFLTTPANRPFICSSLPPSSSSAITVVDIPFPQNISGIPPGVESTDKLPDISLMVPFAAATRLMQPHFEQILESILSTVSFIITDDFLSWTLESANKYGVPRFVFFAMGSFPAFLIAAFVRRRFVEERDGNCEMVRPTDLPWIKIKKEDGTRLLSDPKFVGTDPYNFLYENLASSSRSHGIVINSFSEIESIYADKWNSTFGPKMWCVGPFSVKVRSESETHSKPAAIQWLDQIEQRGERVLYVAFGTQIEISPEQFEEIKTGLEKSGVNFLWVVRKNTSQLEDGFEERVRERGIIVREWVDQREILEHGAVEGFMSQCGWTSIMESICAKVPILAFPMMWHHPLNAILVAEDLKVGLRVQSRHGFVNWETLASTAKELMEGHMGKEVRKNAADLGASAAAAVEEGGSSWRSLKQLFTDFAQTRKA